MPRSQYVSQDAEEHIKDLVSFCKDYDLTAAERELFWSLVVRAANAEVKRATHDWIRETGAKARVNKARAKK